MTSIKLNEWQEEEVGVKAKVPEISPDGKTFNYVEKEIKGVERVMYVDPPKRTVICPRGKHDFFPRDTSKGIFSCRKCDYRYKTFPVTHTYYEDGAGGHLKDKRSGSLV